jgi:hypothetical protein
MNMLKKSENIFHLIIIFIITILLIHSELIGNLIWKDPLIYKVFGDHNTPIDWLQCHSLGIDLFTNEKIECGIGKEISKFNYGYIFLSIPYNKVLDIFYREYLPYTVIFLFIFMSIKITNPKKKVEKLIIYLALLNPSTLLLVERLNFDIFIYLASILIALNRIYFLNWFIAFYLTLIKIYPIILFVTIFIENNKRSLSNIFLITFFIASFSILYLFYFKEYYIFFIKNLGTAKAGYHYLFSLNSIPKIFKYLFDFNYQILLIIFYSLFIYLITKVYKNLGSLQSYLENNIYTQDSKLFIIGSFTCVICFFIFSNYFYREVFLILIIPHVINLKNNSKNNILNFLMYFLIIRYFYLFLYSYINVHDGINHIDGVRVFSKEFLLVIFIKALFDFILMSIISGILYLKIKILIKNKITN